jgi:SAM-dependent methyltransferase
VSAPFRCLACTGGEGRLLHARCPDLYLGRPFVVDFWKCAACGLVQQHPLPEDTSAFYEAYPVHARKSRLYSALRWAVMGPMYCALGGLPPGAVVVDYGCGDGGFLDAQRGRGFELVGFEPDAGQAERLSRELGLSVFGALDPLLAAHAGRADVVTLHMVLEHLTDPDQALSAVARLLKPGGTVYAVVPHLDSWEARWFGRRWHNLDPPRHVFFPLPPHVERMAARHGLRVEGHAPVPFPNGFAASLAVAGGRFRFPLFALALPAGVVVSRLFPQGSRAYRLKAA